VKLELYVINILKMTNGMKNWHRVSATFTSNILRFLVNDFAKITV
jgi:hypothetical protein